MNCLSLRWSQLRLPAQRGKAIEWPRQVIAAKIRAVDDLQSELVQQVKYGSTLEVDLIDSKAQELQANQDLLTIELQLSDLRLKFNDIVGLPLKTDVALDPDVPTAPLSGATRMLSRFIAARIRISANVNARQVFCSDAKHG